MAEKECVTQMLTEHHIKDKTKQKKKHLNLNIKKAKPCNFQKIKKDEKPQDIKVEKTFLDNKHKP